MRTVRYRWTVTDSTGNTTHLDEFVEVADGFGFAHGEQVTKRSIGPVGELTPIGGFTTVRDGDVYENVVITGGVTVRHHTVLRNFRIIGSPSAGSAGYTVKHTLGAGKRLELYNGEIVTRSPATKGLVMFGDGSVRAERVIFRGGTDNVFVKPEGPPLPGERYAALFRECWFGDLQQSPSSHRDCLQIDGPAPGGTLVDRCRLMAFNVPDGADPLTVEADGTSLGSAALILTGDGGIDRVHLRDSWFAGGNYTVDLRGAGATDTALTGCRLGVAHRFGPLLSNAGAVKSGNRWGESGMTVCCGPVQAGQPLP